MDKRERLFTEVRELYNKMSWLNGEQMKDVRFEDYKSSEVHCIEFIGKHPDSNVTRLAESFYMTRGAISKLTRKLMEKGAIESYQKPDNKKEIYFRLTSKGQNIFDVHETLHNEFAARDKAVYDGEPEAHFDIMLRFVEKYSRHLDAEIKKQGLELK